MAGTTVALAGATGGAGTTRTAVELGAMLARDGRDVAILDAAYATQGLSQYLPGRLAPDVTALVTDETRVPLAAGLVEFDLPVPGRLACCPAAAPFERIARAKAVEPARRLADRIEEAAGEFEFVLVDVPPLADNPGVAAVTAADRVATVAPSTLRGEDARQSLRGRLADVGLDPAETVSVAVELDGAERAGGSAPEADTDADAVVPATAANRVADAPACLGEDEFARGVAAATATVCDCTLGVRFPEGGLFGSFRRN